MKPLWLAAASIALALVAPSASFGGDPDFNALVKDIESHYGIRQTHIPLMGLVNGFVKVSRPSGTHELRLAVFEDLPESSTEEGPDLDALLRKRLGSGWKPLVRVHSSRDSEWISIYVRDQGKHMGLMLATLEPREATLIEMKIDVKELARWLAEPERMGHCFGSDKKSKSRECDDGM